MQRLDIHPPLQHSSDPNNQRHPTNGCAACSLKERRSPDPRCAPLRSCHKKGPSGRGSRGFFRTSLDQNKQRSGATRAGTSSGDLRRSSDWRQPARDMQTRGMWVTAIGTTLQRVAGRPYTSTSPCVHIRPNGSPVSKISTTSTPSFHHSLLHPHSFYTTRT